jgi:hypothetical protein
MPAKEKYLQWPWQKLQLYMSMENIAVMVRIPVKAATDSDSNPPSIPIQSRPVIPVKTANAMRQKFGQSCLYPRIQFHTT